MTCCHRMLAVVSICVTALGSASCAKAPPAPPPAAAPPALTIVAPPEAKVKASMTLAAAADVNPNDAQRPSPIVVRVYQLKTDGSFKNTSFAAIYQDDQKVLGQELISRDEYVLMPGEHKTIDVSLSDETRFVGAVAAFQNINDAVWRAFLPTPRKELTIAVERARIVLTGQ